MQVEKIKLVSDDCLRRLYKRFSERMYAAGWMHTTRLTALEFIEWLDYEEELKLEDYEIEGVAIIREVLDQEYSGSSHEEN
jgi:hypothetical protein